MKNSKNILENKQRNSNIELLRIMSAISVIVLHYNYFPDGSGGAVEVANGFNYYFLLLLEAFSTSAVNIFVLISGYYLYKSSDRNLLKPFKLILQVIIFNFVFYFLGIVVKGNVFTLKGFAKNIMPENYFVMYYIVLYFISPYINIFINNLSNNKQLYTMLIIFTIMFSFYPTILDYINSACGYDFNGSSTISCMGSLHGYSIINFIYLYIIGASINKLSINRINKNLILILLFCSTIFTFLSSISRIVFFRENAYSYCNPFVIITAFLTFILFLRINIDSKLINTISRASLTCYLIHGRFLKYLMIEKYVKSNLFIVIIHLLTSLLFIYIISMAIYYIYNKTIRIFFNKFFMLNIFNANIFDKV